MYIYMYIYCLCFANPAEATGGLEAWRLEARCLRYTGIALVEFWRLWARSLGVLWECWKCLGGVLRGSWGRSLRVLEKSWGLLLLLLPTLLLGLHHFSATPPASALSFLIRILILLR